MCKVPRSTAAVLIKHTKWIEKKTTSFTQLFNMKSRIKKNVNILSEMRKNEMEMERQTDQPTKLMWLTYGDFYYIIISILIKRHFIIIIHGIREHQIENQEPVFVFAVIIIYSRGIDVMF